LDCIATVMSDEILKSPDFEAPILEAVILFRCSLPGNVTMEEVHAKAEPLLKEAYPKTRKLLMQEVSIQIAGECTESTHRIRGFQYIQEDGKQLVQFLQDGFSFNRLIPYSSFDEYVEEIGRVWNIYKEITQPILLKQLSMRYINRVVIPFDQSTAEIRLEDYLTIAPRAFPGDELQIEGLLQNMRFQHPESKMKLNLTVSSEPLNDSGAPFIIDIDAIHPLDSAPVEVEALSEKIQSLRDWKNLIFQTTLTKKCLSQFLQPRP